MDKFFNRYENYILKSVSDKHKAIMIYYVSFIALGFDAVKNDNIKLEVKLKKFDLLYRQIFKRCALKGNIIYKLQECFITENISLSLLSDMINFFKDLSLKEQYKSWNRFVHTNQLFFSPFVRMIMVLNELDASVYMPFMSMMMCLSLLEDYNGKKIEELRDLSEKEYYGLYKDRIMGFFKEAKILSQVVANRSFRFKILYIEGLLNVMMEKFSRKEKLIFSNVDLSKILFYAVVKWLFTRVKTLKIKGT